MTPKGVWCTSHSFSDTPRKSGVRAGITIDGTSLRRRLRMRWLGSRLRKSLSALSSNGFNKSRKSPLYTNPTWKMAIWQDSKRSPTPSRYYPCATSNTWRKEGFWVKTRSTYMGSFYKVWSRTMRNRFWSSWRCSKSSSLQVLRWELQTPTWSIREPMIYLRIRSIWPLTRSNPSCWSAESSLCWISNAKP